jgi:hypothetical protein
MFLIAPKPVSFSRPFIGTRFANYRLLEPWRAIQPPPVQI